MSGTGSVLPYYGRVHTQSCPLLLVAALCPTYPPTPPHLPSPPHRRIMTLTSPHPTSNRAGFYRLLGEATTSDFSGDKLADSTAFCEFGETPPLHWACPPCCNAPPPPVGVPPTHQPTHPPTHPHAGFWDAANRVYHWCDGSLQQYCSY